MSFSHRFFLYGPFLLFVALAVTTMGYWWISADAFAKRLDAMNGREVVPGVHMHFGSKRIAGFPFRLDAVFRDFTLTTDGARGPITWHTNDFATHRLTYSSDVTILEAAGPQDLSWTDEDGARRTFRFTPGLLHASAVIEEGKLRRFDLDTIGLNAPEFAAARAQLHLRRDPAADALDLVVDLNSVRFAGDSAAGFANGLSHARIEGKLAPAAPFAAVLSGDAPWRAALDTWRARKGDFKVDQAAFFWGKCEATSAGAVMLDDAHRITGSLAFSLADCDALAKDAAHVTDKPKAHRAILTVLDELSRREPADASGAFPATIVFKDGVMFLGPGKSPGPASFFEPIGFLHPVY